MPVACWSRPNTLTHIILLMCVVPGVSNWGLRIAWSEATTTYNSNVPFAYYRSKRSSLCFSTVVVVKLCNSNMQCSSGFSARGGGSCPTAPLPLWLRHCTGRQHCSTETVLLIFSVLQTNILLFYHQVKNQPLRKVYNACTAVCISNIKQEHLSCNCSTVQILKIRSANL